MKVAVIGSRNFNNYELLEKELTKHKITLLISGGAIGADSLADQYAKQKGLPILIYYPNWNKFGKQAGFIRNEKIIKSCDKVIAFWDGISKGTLNSINHAKKLNKELIIINFNKIKEESDLPFYH